MSAAAPRPIVILGANGQVGYELCRTLAPLAPLVACYRSDLDLTNTAAIESFLADVKPRVVVNAAAYTAVDQAEQEPALAQLINAHAPAAIGRSCVALGAALIHYSTDYVFDGTATQPYRETDAVNPASVYGETKCAGERALLEQAELDVLIFRTAWVYGLRGSNFLRTMQRVGAERDELSVVNDQSGCPTPAWFIAQTTAAVIAQCMVRQDFADKRGLYHLVSRGETSWCGFARNIFENTPDLQHVKVSPITTAEYPTPAKRPAYSVLDTGLIEQQFGLYVPHWQELLVRTMSPSSATAGRTRV